MHDSVNFGYTPFGSHTLVKLNVKVHPNCSLDKLRLYENVTVTPHVHSKNHLHRFEGILTYAQLRLFQKDLKDLRLRTRLQFALDAVEQHRANMEAEALLRQEDDDLPF